jgi:hypothetical protein
VITATKLSLTQRRVLLQTADGQVKHRVTGIESWWAPNIRSYTHRVNRTAESLLRVGLIARGTTPHGNPDWPYYIADVTDAGRALLADNSNPEGN